NLAFDTTQISFDELIKAFFVAHDPTQLNRQGNDVGTQYRSVIFYHNPLQKDLSEKYISALDLAKAYDKPIVTKIETAQTFYPAENYHQQYYELNKSEPYCRFVIAPKMEKFNKVFKDKLKPVAKN